MLAARERRVRKTQTQPVPTNAGPIASGQFHVPIPHSTAPATPIPTVIAPSPRTAAMRSDDAGVCRVPGIGALPHHSRLPPSSFFFSSVTFIPRPLSSLQSTSNATGMPASSLLVPFTMLS